MSSGTGQEPTKVEIEKQLDRMLSSAVFEKAPKQSRLLRFVVERALTKTTISAKDITDAMFRSVDLYASHARANASFLRARINEYYQGSGADDLVLIELPSGPGYRPKFSYHPKSVAIRWFRKGVALRDSGSGEAFWYSRMAFQRAIALDKDYVAAHAAIAEIDLLQFLVGHIVPILPPLPQKTWMKDPQDRLDSWKFDPDVWLLHVVVGIEYLIRGQKARAISAMEHAIKADAASTSRSPWYAIFLLLTGKEAEGLQIAEALANEQPENAYASVLYGFFLYVLRDFERAADVLKDIRMLDQAQPFCNLVCGLVWLGLRRWEEAFRCFKAGSEIGEREWLSLVKEYGWEPPRPQRFAGLMILALVKNGDGEKAAELFEVLKHHRFVKPFQKCLAYLAMGEDNEAYEQLRNAYRMGDPFAIWMRLWAVFDDARSSRFEAFAEKLNL